MPKFSLERLVTREMKQAAEAKAAAYRLYRSTFVERMEPEEAALLDAVLSTAEPKLRLMFQSVDYFMSDDPLFAVIHWTVATALGSDAEPDFVRADELLALPQLEGSRAADSLPQALLPRVTQSDAMTRKRSPA